MYVKTTCRVVALRMFFKNEIIGWHTLTHLYSKLMVDALNTGVISPKNVLVMI